MKRFNLVAGLLLFVSLVLVACQTSETPSQTASEMMQGDESYGTFSQALEKIGMTNVGENGELTIFVPTTDAFQNYADANGITLEALLASPDLEKVLTYHMADGLLTAADITALSSINSRTGDAIAVEVKDGSVILNASAKVIVADLKAKNVVIHVIDTVLEPASEPQPTIVELAVATPDLSTLVAAVKAAGLVDTLSSEGPFTVFAPTNAAFEAALKALDLSAEELLGNKELLTKILTYHVVAGEFFAADVLAKQSLKTVQGEDIAVDAANVKVNDSKIIATDIDASNGVVHLIDAVLLPPSLTQKPQPNIVELAVATPDLSILVAAVKAAGLVDTLSGEGPFTVFAPTNAAFEAALKALGLTAEELLANKELLTTVLTYHVLAGELFAADVLAASSLTPLQGEDIVVDAANLKLNNSTIIATDIDASNGVVHLIDAVLLPPSLTKDPTPSIVDTVVNNPDFSILLAAVKKAGLVDALSAEGPLTVFAPNNKAFERLAHDLGVEVADLLELPNLKDILLYHVASGALDAATIAQHKSVTTLQGGKVYVSLPHGDVFLNHSKVIAADIKVSNGIIHVIDAVLLPK